MPYHTSLKGEFDIDYTLIAAGGFQMMLVELVIK